MPGKTTYLSADDFVKRSDLTPNGFECTVNGSYFRKGDSLSNQKIKEVLDICNKYHSVNINTLIIKDQETLTIWVEEISSKSTINSEKDVFDESQVQTPINNQSLPTKTITKRYRGQVYEETVVDWAAVQQANQQNKPRRKYRGQYID